jgi:protein-S-isoprenylcysteine O-methyltransferase Ste14
MSAYSRRQRLVALLYGIACHAAFAAAVGAMMYKLYTGLRGGPALSLPLAIAWDALLILQFPLLHSLLLTPRGGRWLARLVPAGIGTELRSTTFALVASLQILLAFLAWAPLGPEWFRWSGLPWIVSSLVYASGWLLLLKSMSDAGLDVQMGYLGWWAVFRNRTPAYRAWQERGSLRHTRHPMYLAYALLLWSGPVWSVDHLLMALPWTVYCVLGPLHKEARYLRRHGEAFREYRRRVPYFFPRPQAPRTRP